jgi:Ca2+-binding EF-hand superfamily protein
MRSLQFVTGACLTVALGATVLEAQQGRRMRFRGMDVNRDGVITRSEWRGNARSFDVHDLNQDGVLSGNEVSLTGDRDAYRDRDGWDELVDVFDSVDRNNDGLVSRDEWYGDRSTFTRLDRDRNGTLRLSEFLASDVDPMLSNDANDEQVVGTVGRDVVRTRAYQAGLDRGVLDGREAGRADRSMNRAWDLEGQRELEQADAGYDNSMGRRDHYQAGYRAGFRQGYRQGFGPR